MARASVRQGPCAIIIGGSFHSLGAARNLAKNGVRVCLLDSQVSVSHFSRSVALRLGCPSPDDELEFVESLISTAQAAGLEGAVLFPSTDEYVRIVAQNHARLGAYYRLTTPPWDVVKHVYDKRLTAIVAQDWNLPIPETRNPGSLADVDDLDLSFPVVLKPAISKQFMAATRKKAVRADSPGELLAVYQEMAAIIEPSYILVQELIPGRGANLFSYVGLFESGFPLAGLAARRARQHPMEFGRASTFVESVDVPELRDLATRCLEAIGYSGLAEVEIMYDERDERYELLEVNPRIWGWHSIADHSGIDLPYMAYERALGHPVKAGNPRPNVAWVRLVTDIPTVLHELLAGRLGIREYLDSMSRDIGFAVWSPRDPLPFLADVILAPYNYITSGGF